MVPSSETNWLRAFEPNKKTFVFDTDLGGKLTKLRYAEVQMSPKFYTYQAEASVDSGHGR